MPQRRSAPRRAVELDDLCLRIPWADARRQPNIVEVGGLSMGAERRGNKWYIAMWKLPWGRERRLHHFRGLNPLHTQPRSVVNLAPDWHLLLEARAVNKAECVAQRAGE